MDFEKTGQAVDAYLETMLVPADPVLEAIAAASDEAGLVPHAVTPLQAAFLALLIRTNGARSVLEIGCLGGYSAVAMARVLPEGGCLVTTEIDTRTAQIAQDNIDGSGFGHRIELRVGPAMEAIMALREEGRRFDFVFIDADKANHAAYFEAALELASPGALIVADNIVRGGAIIDPEDRTNSVLGVRNFFDAVSARPELEVTALQTLGAKGYDGFALIRVAG